MEKTLKKLVKKLYQLNHQENELVDLLNKHISYKSGVLAEIKDILSGGDKVLKRSTSSLFIYWMDKNMAIFIRQIRVERQEIYCKFNKDNPDFLLKGNKITKNKFTSWVKMYLDVKKIYYTEKIRNGYPIYVFK